VSKVTPLYEEPRDRLRSVEWFCAVADLPLQQAYEVIRSGKMPPECVVRIGRRIRLVESRVYKWLGLEPGAIA
jgi:hypothetical protein